MSESQYIQEATPENYAELVIGNSLRGPVMVNYWSAKAGPCLKLWPVLEKLVHEFSGKYLLVNLDVDKYFEFARKELGITSVPTVKMYFQQQVVDTIHGAESEHSFRSMLIKHLPRQSDAMVFDAVKSYQQQNTAESIEQLRQLYKTDPENLRIPVALMKLMFREGQLQEVVDFIETLPERFRKKDEVLELESHAQFLLAANMAPDKQQLLQQLDAEPGNSAARHQLSALYLVEDDYPAAMDQLLEIMRTDRSYKNDVATKGMVAILNLIGSDTELARQYRQKMIDILSL